MNMEILKKILEKINSIDKKKRLYFVVVFLIVSIMLWAFISAGVITGNFNREQLKGTQDDQKVDAIGVIITETKDGAKYFEIYGETGNYTNEKNVATLYNVVGNFYRDGKVGMSFQSSKGAYDEVARTITLYENTYIVLDNGTSLASDKFIWSGSDNDIVAVGNVKIKKSDEMYATAHKCIISPDYSKFKIVGKSNTKIYGKES